MVEQTMSVLSKKDFIANTNGIATKWYMLPDDELSLESLASDVVFPDWKDISLEEKEATYDHFFKSYFRREKRKAKQQEFYDAYGLDTNGINKIEAKRLFMRYYQKERRYWDSPKPRVQNILSRQEYFRLNDLGEELSEDEKEIWNHKYQEYYQAEYRKNYTRKKKRIRFNLEITPEQKEALEQKAIRHKRFSVEDAETENLRVKNFGRFILQCAESYLSETRIQRDPDTLNEVMRQYKGIATNINHLVRMTAKRERTLKETFIELRHEVNRLASAQVQYFMKSDDLFYSIDEMVAENPAFLSALEKHIGQIKKGQGQ